MDNLTVGENLGQSQQIKVSLNWTNAVACQRCGFCFLRLHGIRRSDLFSRIATKTRVMYLVTCHATSANTAYMSIRTWCWPVVARAVLAGPVVVGVTLLVVGCMPVWFPKGAAGIDHIALPIIMLPGIWAILFFHAVLDRQLLRVAVVEAGLASLSVGMLIWKFSVSA
jgi:hypothetical protein